MGEKTSKQSSENRPVGVSDNGQASSWQKSAQSKGWAAPELYLSHSEATAPSQESTKKSTVSAEVFDDFQPSEVLTGKTFNNRYKVLEVLGEGAMAVVYDAMDLQTGKMIAAKTLKYAESTLAVRFSREIEIHQKLKHPNIVDALECVEGPNNLCLFMMEKVDGKDLEECLEELYRFDDLGDYASILAQLCDGLEHAHQKGVIHRDLKPENIILKLEESNIKLKILDFGVAKIQEDLQKLTKTGLVIGSPAYMSPEQCIGRKLSEKSDIYSVGVLAFELLTGELPYEAMDPVSMMKAHCSPDIFPKRITDVREDTPAANTLQGIINATLQYDPELRYKNINQLKIDLDTWWKEAGIGQEGEESPFNYVDPSELPEEKEEDNPLKQDFSRLSELIDTQRQTQANSLRENFKEGSLPKKEFDIKKYMPIGIAFGGIIILACLFFALSQFVLKPQDNNAAKQEVTQTTKPLEEKQAKPEAKNQEKPEPKKKKKKKRRKIIAPGWVQK